MEKSFTDKIEKEFDEKFEVYRRELFINNIEGYTTISYDIKQFLHQSLEFYKKELIKKIEEMKTDIYWVGENPETDEKEVMDSDKSTMMWGEDMSFAYNNALKDIINLIDNGGGTGRE